MCTSSALQWSVQIEYKTDYSNARAQRLSYPLSTYANYANALQRSSQTVQTDVAIREKMCNSTERIKRFQNHTELLNIYVTASAGKNG